MPKIRTFVGLAILAGLLFVGPAFSQVSPQVCAVNVGVQPTVRAEGNTERVGEITFTCTGGIPNGAGQVLPAVNIQVILNTAVTSRIYPNGFSEAMVMIDEPGSGLAGTTNTQLACNDPNGICVVTGKGAGSGDFDGTQGRPNIFPGKVSGNSVTFFGIPVDPPGNGPSRVYRFVNIRANATSLSGSGGSANTNLLASISISGATSLALSNPTPTVAFVSQSLTATLRSPDSSSAGSATAANSCSTPQRIGVLRFSESFGTAFASRTSAAFVNGDTSPAPALQNVPGKLYQGESGFYNPALIAPTVNFQTVGLADAGTRLKTVFNNIPAGARLWVSLRNAIFAGGNPSAASAGTVARLTSGEASAFAPVAASTTLEGIPATELPIVNGTATAAWEVLANNPNLIENFDFVVWVQAGTVAGTATVNLSYAPTPPAPFSAAAAGAASATLPIPRFLADSNPAIALFNSSACQIPTTTALSASLNNVAAGTPVTLTATVFANAGTAAGTVSFLDGNVPIVTVPVVNGSAATVATLAQGVHTLTAAFSNATGAFLPSASAPVVVTVTAPSALAITTPGLPSGTSGTLYSAKVTATGGVGPYTWSASGLPPGLGINPQTGDIGGTPQSSGTFPVVVRVTDAQGTNAQAAYSITINLPLTLTPAALPNGTVGVSYQATIGISGGSNAGPFTFAVSSGNLPDGLALTQNGLIIGTPSKAGIFGFSITASDANRNSASKSFTITIGPAVLTAPAGGTTNATVGRPVTIDLTPTGGTPPYGYSLNCTLPPGLTLNNGVISGTPTTAGTTTCRVVISDSGGNSVTKDIIITVAVAPLTFTGSTLPNGQVGVSYTGSVAATGGTPPLKYAGSGLPDGLSLASSGAITGTPGTEGSFSFSATATDAAGAKATASFRITIDPAKLTVTTATLPDGVMGTSYSASLAATGGVKPYTWTVAGFPGGVAASSTGVISGTPNVAGKFNVTATVKDNAGATASGSFSVTIALALPVITTATLPNGTVGTAYTASVAATGGVPPFTWSATGLPAGLNMSAAGAISGTPTAPGTSNASVTVRDSAGTSTSKAFTIVIGLPATPPLNFLGITNTANPLQQPRLNVSLGTAYPLDVVVTLTLTFAPDTGAGDPSIVFSGGERTARITVPAGSLTGISDVGLQTGTVAGLITITAQLQTTGLDVTPSPAPRQTIRISPGVPVMTTATAARSGTGFTMTINGYATNREVTQAIFTFNPAAGANLQTTSLTVTVDTLFSGYFGGSAAAPFGSLFTYIQPFTVNGSLQAVASVTVTLVNRIGNSTAVTVNLN